jgi:hypothetical protein
MGEEFLCWHNYVNGFDIVIIKVFPIDYDKSHLSTEKENSLFVIFTPHTLQSIVPLCTYLVSS